MLRRAAQDNNRGVKVQLRAMRRQYLVSRAPDLRHPLDFSVRPVGSFYPVLFKDMTKTTPITARVARTLAHRRVRRARRSRFNSRLRLLPGFSMGRYRTKAFKQRQAQTVTDALEAENQTAVRLRSEVSRRPALAPLLFAPVTTKRVISEAELAARKVGLAATTYDRYRRTTTIAESTSEFYPALMSLLMKRKLNGQEISYDQAAGMVKATY